MVGVLGPNPSVDTGYKPQVFLRLELLKDTEEGSRMVAILCFYQKLSNQAFSSNNIR